MGLAVILVASWAAPCRTVFAQDTPEDQQAHAAEEGMPAAAVNAVEAGGEKKADEIQLRSRQEGEEELPAEFEPNQVIPFDQSRLGLPGWQETGRHEAPRRQHFANQGGGLFPPEIWPLQSGAAAQTDFHGNGGGQEPASGAPAAGPLGQKQLDGYFARKPDQVFLDPQQLLPPVIREEMESRVRRWLNADGPFRTTVMLFGPGQQLPPSVDAEAILRQWAGSGVQSLNQVLVFYYLNEPDRTKVVFSAGTSSRFPEVRLAEAVTSAVRAAGRVEGGQAQLERFCYKVTVHLHRLAQAQPGAGGVRARKPFWRGQHPAVLAVAGAVAAAVLWGMLRKRRNSGKGGKALPVPVLLPEQDFHTRLSAPHSGGLAAVITFPPLNHR